MKQMKAMLLLSIVGLLFLSMPSFAKDTFFFASDATIKELAIKNNLKTSKLIHELDDELGFKSVKPLSTAKEIGLVRQEFEKLYLHMHEELTPLVITGMIVWIFIGMLVLWLLKQKKLTQTKRIVIFSFVILFFGIFLHAKPGAMEAIVKVFKATAGKDSWHLKVLFFSFFSMFSIIASNLFCSVGCQVGVIQDFMFQLLRLKKIKYRKISFWITNGIRIIIFSIFLLFMYEILVGIKSASLYHSVNIFKVYILNLGSVGVITFSLTILLSGFIYRPFCSLICPFGLWSWILSNFSFQKIKIDHDACIECKKCVRVCPNDAMDAIYHEHLVKKDCYVCGECINQCPRECIDFK